MVMNGEVVIDAERDQVWAALNDAETLKKCIPGCETLEKASDTSFTAVVKTKIGPISTTFRGKVNLSDINPPSSYLIQGEGEGGMAGFAKGGAKVVLSDHPAGTRLVYDVEANVGGKLMQLGSRLINSVTKKMADEFFSNFAKALKSTESAGV
jgi:carbon monoxide dehydrogenase subunit G